MNITSHANILIRIFFIRKRRTFTKRIMRHMILWRFLFDATIKEIFENLNGRKKFHKYKEIQHYRYCDYYRLRFLIYNIHYIDILKLCYIHIL